MKTIAAFAATAFLITYAAVPAEEECTDGVCPLPASFGTADAVSTNPAVNASEAAKPPAGRAPSAEESRKSGHGEEGRERDTAAHEQAASSTGQSAAD
ncbi:hypothetical protein GX586_03480 [bacterium]|nr:hypothetical protein [bacterium]